MMNENKITVIILNRHTPFNNEVKSNHNEE